MTTNLSALACVLALASASFGALPANFVEKVIAPKTNFNEATSMAFSDDGRIFISERNGTVRVVDGDSAKKIHEFKTTTNREQGLLKIQVHPGFAGKSWLYGYYMTADNNHHNVSRITLDKDNVVTRVDTVIRLPVLENQGRHNGSGLVFGKDGFLYVSRGNDELGGGNNPAGLWNSQKGKVLRFTDEGLPAPGNPHYTSGANDGEKSIWARGFRNPWTMAADPYSGRIFEGDVGDGTEEVNDVTKPDAAKDYWYGYGVGGGDGVGAGGGKATDPIYYHGTGNAGECAIVAEAPYNSAQPSNWPATYKNKLYVADYCGGAIRMVPLDKTTGSTDINAGGNSQMFQDNSRIKVGLYIGPDGNLYYVNYTGSGKAYRIEYNGPTGLADAGSAAAPHALSAALDARGEMTATLSTGLPPGESGKARLTVKGPDGKTEWSRDLSVSGNRLSLSLPPLRAGLHVCELRWGDSRGTHWATGRLMQLAR